MHVQNHRFVQVWKWKKKSYFLPIPKFIIQIKSKNIPSKVKIYLQRWIMMVRNIIYCVLNVCLFVMKYSSPHTAATDTQMSSSSSLIVTRNPQALHHSLIYLWIVGWNSVAMPGVNQGPHISPLVNFTQRTCKNVGKIRKMLHPLPPAFPQ